MSCKFALCSCGYLIGFNCGYNNSYGCLTLGSDSTELYVVG